MMRRWSGVLAALVLALALNACAAGSKVKRGALYGTGEPVWDAYFRDVHAIQSSAPQWWEAKRASRKSLCDELKLAADAPDATIAQATHERVLEVTKIAGPVTLEVIGDEPRVAVPGGAKNIPDNARPLFAAVESTARAEIDRARRMRATTVMVDRVMKAGHELEPRLATDFAQKSKQRQTEVKTELTASFEALEPFRGTTQGMAQGAEDFVLDLKRAILTASGLPVPPVKSKPAKPGKGDKGKGGKGDESDRTDRTPTAPKPASPPIAATPAPPKPDAPAPPPKPKKPPAEEVFNP